MTAPKLGIATYALAMPQPAVLEELSVAVPSGEPVLSELSLHPEPLRVVGGPGVGAAGVSGTASLTGGAGNAAGGNPGTATVTGGRAGSGTSDAGGGVSVTGGAGVPTRSGARRAAI